ncbi:Nsp1-like C-terminal region-domain-containing protein [Phellopilus nigrolimitatus]|nr:Nsp1-like C-terminal region-domain-containing protein [Phellopilus nigrolimitatus]
MSQTLPGGFSSFSSANAFKPTGTTTASGTNLFGNNTAPTTNTGATGAPAGAPNAFGGSGGNLFSNFGSKPATTTGSLFGGPAAGGGPSPFSAFGGAANSAAPANNTAGALPSQTPFGAKPAEQSAPGASTAPKPGGLFSQPASSAAPGASNFFAAPPKPAEPGTSTPAPAPAATGNSLFGGGLFGKKPDASAPAAAGASSTSAAPAAPSLFAGFGAKKDDDSAKDKDKAAAPAVFPAASGSALGLFGLNPAENKDLCPISSTQSVAPAFPYFRIHHSGYAIFKTSSSPTGAAVTSSTPTNVSIPPPSMLRGKTIEEIVNKWSSELETHVREFNRLAGEVTVWDRALIDNGNTIAALFQHVLLAEREQSDVEQSLKHVEDQQRELATTLEGEIFEGQGGGLRALDVGPADAERDKHYTLAADLNANLDDLSRSLMQMIDSVNELSESPEDAVGSDGDSGKSKSDAPLEQIAQILSSHLESLQWIDGAVREVDSKVVDVERRVREASASSRTNGSVGSLAGSVGGVNGTPRPRGFGLR